MLNLSIPSSLKLNRQSFIFRFIRAMYYSAKRGIACRLSVCL